MSIYVENQVGRLVEFRVGPIVTSDEYVAAMARMQSIIKAIGRPVVSANDCRASVGLPPSLAVTVIKAMRANNPYIERSGLLLPPNNSALVLQGEHVIESAALPTRRIFQSTTEMCAWLDEVLDADERARLREFLR